MTTPPAPPLLPLAELPGYGPILWCQTCGRPFRRPHQRGRTPEYDSPECKELPARLQDLQRCLLAVRPRFVEWDRMRPQSRESAKRTAGREGRKRTPHPFMDRIFRGIQELVNLSNPHQFGKGPKP